MHTGIRTAGAGDRYRVIGDETKRFFDGSLHGLAMRKALPAEEVGSVVFDTQGDAQHDLRDQQERNSNRRTLHLNAG